MIKWLLSEARLPNNKRSKVHLPCNCKNKKKKREAFQLSHDLHRVNHLQWGWGGGLLFKLVIEPAIHDSLFINTQRGETWNSSGCESSDTKQSSFLLAENNAGRQSELCSHYETTLSQDKRLTGMLLWHMRAVDTRVKHWTAHTHT